MKNQYEKSREEIKKIYNRGNKYSGDASKIARQLAFGEGAIFWFFFFREPRLAIIITIGLLFLVLYFIFDISQYIIATWVNKNLASTYEHLNSKDAPMEPEKIQRPPSMNNPISACYYIKFIMLSLASLIVISIFVCLLIHTPEITNLKH